MSLALGAGEGAARGRGARALLRRGRHGGGAYSAVFSAAAHLRLPYRGRRRSPSPARSSRACSPTRWPGAQRNRRKRRSGLAAGALLRARALGLRAGAASGLCRRAAERAAGAAHSRAHRGGEDNPRPRGVAVSGILSAGIDAIVTFWPDALNGYSDFRIGSLANLTMPRIAPAFWVVLIALALLLR